MPPRRLPLVRLARRGRRAGTTATVQGLGQGLRILRPRVFRRDVAYDIAGDVAESFFGRILRAITSLFD